MVSDTRSIDDLISELGMGPDEVRHGSIRFPAQVAWVLRAVGTGATDLTLLIEDVLTRIEPLADAIARAVQNSDDSAILRITQYIGDDPVGPGFSLDAAALRLLARLDAFVDVDQYFDPVHEDLDKP